MTLKYKLCDISDLESLVQISRLTFIDAFEKVNNPEDFKTYLNTAFSKAQLKSELLNTDAHFYFVFQNSSLVAYFKLCEFEAQGEPNGDKAIELSRIYVLQKFQGQRIGYQILQEIISIARAKHKTQLWLGVWQLNTDAVRFYERYGFKKYNTHSFYVGNDKQTDWLMRLDLV